MYLEEPAAKAMAALPRIGKEALVPALVCAAASVLLMRAGFLTIFFLVPLGVCAVVFGPAAAWLGAVLATLGNAAWSAGFFLRYGGLSNLGLNMLYFAVLSLGFTWVMAGNPPENRWVSAIPRVRTLFRFTAAAVAGALVFLAMVFSLGSDEAFFAALRSQIEAIASPYIAAAETDAAQRAYLEQTLTADKVIDLFMMIVVRGGALVSALFLLFFSRQAAFFLARLFRRQGGSVAGDCTRRTAGSETNTLPKHQPLAGDLIGFHAPRRAIGVVSLCLLAILLCRITSLGIIEVAAWNILVMCATMFLAQGGGIALFFLARRPVPVLMRLIGIVAFVCVMFSPGLNALALALLILLGIAENWLPLRIKSDIRH